ncbi:hypothetical protein Bca101_076182 [Brassica carinata]
MVHFSVDFLRGLFYEETIDDIDYKRKVQVQVQDLDQSIVLLINSEILSRCERMVTIVLMMLYAWRESSSIQGISNGDNKTDVELPDGVRGELRESTNANHQPSSYVVPGGGRLA